MLLAGVRSTMRILLLSLSLLASNAPHFAVSALERVSVTSYGAIDSTNAIRAAIANACAHSTATGTYVYLAKGQYLVSGAITFTPATCRNVHLVGAGASQTIIVTASSMNGSAGDVNSSVFRTQNAAGTFNTGISIENLSIDGAQQPNYIVAGNGAAIAFTGCNQCWVRNVLIKNMPGFGAIFTALGGIKSEGGGIVDSTFINNGRGNLANYGGLQADTIGGGFFDGLSIQRNRIYNANGTAIDTVKASRSVYSSNTISGVGPNAGTLAGYIVSDFGSNANTYSGNTFINAGGIELDSSTSGGASTNDVISNNRITGFGVLPYPGGSPVVPRSGGVIRNSAPWPALVTLSVPGATAGLVLKDNSNVIYLFGGSRNRFILPPGHILTVSYKTMFTWSWSAAPNARAGAAIALESATGARPSGVTISGNVVTNIARAGIYVRDGYRINAAYNQVTNPGEAADDAFVFLDASSSVGCSYCVFRGNYFTDTRNPKSFIFDFRMISSGGHNLVTQNHLESGAQISNFTRSGWASSDQIINNNIPFPS